MSTSTRVRQSWLAEVIVIVTASCATLLPFSGRIAALGTVIASCLALAGPIVLLTSILLSAGINLSYLKDNNVLAGAAEVVDPNVLRILVVGAVFVWMVLRNRNLIIPLKQIAPYLVFIAFSLLSLTWSRSHEDGIRLVIQLLYPLVAFSIAAYAARRGKAHLVRWSLLGGAVLSILANGAVYIVESASAGIDAGSRYYGTLGSNPLGLYSATCALAAYAWLNRRPQTLYALVFVALLAQLVATGSRTSLFALGCAVVTISVLRREWVGVLATALLGIAVITLVPSVGARPGVVLGSSATALSDVSDESNLSGRLFIWIDTWDTLVPGAELVGRGLGATTTFMAERYVTLRSVHNEYIRTIAETGFVGLVLLLGSWVHLAMRVTRRRPRARPGGSEWDLVLAVLVLIAVASLTEDTLGGYYYLEAPIWALIGCGLGLADRPVPRNASSIKVAPCD